MKELIPCRRDVVIAVAGWSIAPVIALVEGLIDERSATEVALTVLGEMALATVLLAAARQVFNPQPRALPDGDLVEQLSQWLYRQGYGVKTESGVIGRPNAISVTDSGGGVLWVSKLPAHPVITVAGSRQTTNDEQNVFTAMDPARQAAMLSEMRTDLVKMGFWWVPNDTVGCFGLTFFLNLPVNRDLTEATLLSAVERVRGAGFVVGEIVLRETEQAMLSEWATPAAPTEPGGPVSPSDLRVQP